MAAKNILYVSEEQQQEYEEIDFATHADNKPDFESEMSEPRCPACNELLAWHETTCTVVTPEAVAMPATVVRTSVTSVFSYELGHQVLPVTSTSPQIVTWRGQLKERHLETGMVHRVSVYCLDDGYWDCYREEELQVA